jgi:hypothetical protein
MNVYSNVSDVFGITLVNIGAMMSTASDSQGQYKSFVCTSVLQKHRGILSKVETEAGEIFVQFPLPLNASR